MKPILLCLHGWGGNKASFTELREALKGVDIEILSPDLPGFGEEPEPSRPWTVDDYADWVEMKLRATSYELRDLYVLGHSHGGRIALKIAARKSIPMKHLYLCASAGIRHPRHFKRIIGLTLAKTGSFFLAIPLLNRVEPLAKKVLYKLVRVHDYENASPIMRNTMIKVTQEDLRHLLPSINVPTDIFWGTDDRMTPVGDAYIFKNCIKGSCLHLYQGVRHRVHRDKAADIAAVICAAL